MKKTLGVLAVCLLMTAAAKATTLANWTFETSLPTTAGPHAPEVGAGAGLGFHAAGGTYSNPVGNGSAESFSSNTWAIGDYYEFSTSATGYQGITIQFDQTSSNTGPRDFALEYSTDGVIFNVLTTYSILANASPNNFWTSGTYYPEHTYGPIAGPVVLDNAATVYFRLTMNSAVSANGGTVASAGSNRVDNVIISGTLIPEPATLALLALGGLFVARRR